MKRLPTRITLVTACLLVGAAWSAQATIDSDLPPSLSQEEQDSATKLAAISGKMKVVAQMLTDGETGPATQQRQEEILKDIASFLNQPPGSQGGADQQDSQQEQKKQEQNNGESQQPEQQPGSEQKPQAEQQPSGAQQQQQQAPQTGKHGTGTEGALGGEGGRLQPGRWGELPPRATEELKESLKEEFLEHYRYLLRLYFSRLSEEQKPER